MRLYKDKLLSVTSIIELRQPFDGRAFGEWCKKNGYSQELISTNSRVLGSKVGRWLESYWLGLEGKLEPRFDSLEESLHSGVQKFLENYDIHEMETEVFCEELNYAGKFDAIIQDKGSKELLLVDFKTYGAYKTAPYKRDSKKIKQVRWQTSLYAHALEWDKGPLGVVIFKNDGDYIVEKFGLDEEMITWVMDKQELILETIKNGQVV